MQTSPHNGNLNRMPERLFKEKEDGAVAAYHSFGRAAELQDRGDPAGAAAWLALGKAICAMLHSESPPPQRAFTSIGQGCVCGKTRERDYESKLLHSSAIYGLGLQIKERVHRISDELNVLFDVGINGGNISGTSVRSFAEALARQLIVLRGQVDRISALTRPAPQIHPLRFDAGGRT